MENPNNKVLQALTLASSIGFNFASSLLVGYYGGNWLDSKLGTTPWLMVVGILLGVAAGTWGTIYLVTSIWKEK